MAPPVELAQALAAIRPTPTPAGLRERPRGQPWLPRVISDSTPGSAAERELKCRGSETNVAHDPMSPMGDKPWMARELPPSAGGEVAPPGDSMDLAIVWRPAGPGWCWLALTYVTLSA
jgi:hypothetical protein